MNLRCDGCAATVTDSVNFVTADGHEARYCDGCHEHYKQFAATCLVVEEKYNRMLDQEIAEIRTRVDLLLVPQDLPRAPRALEGLRLG